MKTIMHTVNIAGLPRTEIDKLLEEYRDRIFSSDDEAGVNNLHKFLESDYNSVVIINDEEKCIFVHYIGIMGLSEVEAKDKCNKHYNKFDNCVNYYILDNTSEYDRIDRLI